MKKELRPFHDHVTCDICGRTILKGERTEAYLVQGGQRHLVCELCFVRAEHAGWIRESGADQAPVRPQRQQERRPLLGRLRRRQPDVLNGDEDTDSHDVVEDPFPAEDAPAEPPPEQRRRPPAPERAPRTHDPRHVRAVPSTAEAKVERALDVFNESGHQRTVSGLSRSLGPPFVSAHADAATPSIVNLVVAWELSWYRYRIDLGDASDAVHLAAKGDEMEDIDEALRVWNGALDAEDRLVIGVAQQ